MRGTLDSKDALARCVAFEAAQKRAHEAVRDLPRTGFCSCCGEETETVWHHDSYDQPLDVVELSKPHHDERHRKLGWGYPGGPDGFEVDGPHWTPGPDVPPLEALSLDFAMFDVEPVGAANADPWLERRKLAIGASELAMLFVALGRATPAEVAALPKYLREGAETFLRRKAFPRRSKSAGSAASRGQQAERPVLALWAKSDCPIRAQLASVTHADAAPKSWFPLVDRHCPSLAVTPDGWAIDIFGDDVGLEVKTTVEPIGHTPWWWLAQVQAQNAVGSYAWSVIVVGEGWAHWQAHRRQPPRAIRVEPDPHYIERIRAACRDGWARVEEMRAEKRKAA